MQGLTEPNHGSDPGGMETTAEETDGGFILNGSKTWITNAPVAWVYFLVVCVEGCSYQMTSDVFIIWARCKWDNRVRGFILDKVSQPISALSHILMYGSGSERTVCSTDQEQTCAQGVLDWVHLHGFREGRSRCPLAQVQRVRFSLLLS